MEEKSASLLPIQKLSLLDSIRKGSLRVHRDFYECGSFIRDTDTRKSTYIISRETGNSYLKEFLKTETIRRKNNDILALGWFIDDNSRVLKDEKCPISIQEKCLTLWTQQLKHASFSSQFHACIDSLVTNNIVLIEQYLAWFKRRYE